MRQKEIFIRNLKKCVAAVAVVLSLTSCNEGTGTLGLYADSETISQTTDVFSVFTNSLLMDSVLASSARCYLGSITDPETGSEIQASFAAQFHTFENYQFPKRQLMFPQDGADHSAEQIHCTSCDIRLYFDSYYGDGDNTMKLEVYALDTARAMPEGVDYYSNTDLQQYANSTPIATRVFSPDDYILSETERNSSTYSHNLHIVLPDSVGDEIINAYYRNPEFYKDSYHFIRNVCAGFLFKLKSGSGTMLNVSVGTLNVYFNFYDAESPDSTFEGMARFAATPEVIQTTSIENNNLASLLTNDTCTFLKTPAGICTEVVLPVRDIFSQHENDSLNKARLTLTRYNNKRNDDYSLGIPSTLLLVRKEKMHSFFTSRSVTDSQTSFTTDFDASFNSYTFDNIGRLLTYCQKEKIKGMQDSGLSEAAWEAAHPDWNRVVLIPVKVTTTSDSYGYTHQVRVTHDMDMNSVRLVKGTPQNPIQMQVIYSRFQ